MLVTGWALELVGRTVGIGDGGSITFGKNSRINPPFGTRVLDNSESTEMTDRGLYWKDKGNELRAYVLQQVCWRV